MWNLCLATLTGSAGTEILQSAILMNTIFTGHVEATETQ